MNNFSKELKQLRKSKGITVAELSRRAGFSKSYISRMENGDTGMPKPETVIRLSKALGVSRTFLLKAAGYWDDASDVNQNIDANSEHIRIANFQSLDGIQFVVGAPRSYSLVDEINQVRETHDDDILDLYYLLNMSISETTSVSSHILAEETQNELKNMHPYANEEFEISNIPLKYKGKPLTRKQKERLIYTLELIFEE